MPVPIKPEPTTQPFSAWKPAASPWSSVGSTAQTPSRAFSSTSPKPITPPVATPGPFALQSTGPAAQGTGRPLCSTSLNLATPSSVTQPPSRSTSAAPAFGGNTNQEAEKPVRKTERFWHDRILDFGTKVTTIRIGQEPKHVDFTVHENLLRRSPFFVKRLEALFAFPFLAIAVPEPTAFSVYVQWLYSGRLHTKLSGTGIANSNGQHQKEWFKLTHAYILGHELEDVDFKDTIIDAMLEWFQEAPIDVHPVLLENIHEIYGSLKANSPLCQLVSDIAAWHFDNKAIQAMKAKSTSIEIPNAFLLDTLIKLSNRF